MMECPNCQSELYTEYHPEEDAWTCQNCGWLWSDEITSIRGWAFCPLCDVALAYKAMPDVGETYWHCLKCKIHWQAEQIIETLNEIRRADYAELYQAIH